MKAIHGHDVYQEFLHISKKPVSYNQLPQYM